MYREIVHWATCACVVVVVVVPPSTNIALPYHGRIGQTPSVGHLLSIVVASYTPRCYY